MLGWCMKANLIASRYECPRCKKEMRLQERKGMVDGYKWLCRSQSKDNPHDIGVGSIFKLRSACVEVGTIDKYSACVEVGTTHINTCEEVSIRTISTVLPAKSLNPAAKVEEKQFETLNKETATHISIREAEDWFRPIDLAKECDIYISSKNGSHKEIPITYGYTQDPFKNRSQNFKPKIKENYPQYLERENKNCFICGDSSHYARDCQERFKPKESHIHNRINVNTLKVESEKQNSGEIANLQYVSIFVENQPVTALIDSGSQIPVLNSSLIRVNQPSEEIITLSSCFGEQRMVEVKPINLSLNQHSPGLSVRTAISPTLTEEFIIHPRIK
ncbi:retrovirus-related Pol polyprotein from transposon opus [Trichonephila clavipes]|nr:retrovirus-related Pol polyprotein from transposon opus [Trichonephila clavipes]